MRDKVLDFVKQNGPCLPVEVKICSDSFLSKAYLDELAEKGLLKKSSEKIGESYIYYSSGQESAVQEKIKSLKVEKTARTYAPKKVVITPDIAKKREEFESRLKDIEKKTKATPLSTKSKELSAKKRLTENVKPQIIELKLFLHQAIYY